MEYKVYKNKIVMQNSSEFDIKHILECGQVFRYKVVESGYEVYALEHKARVYCQKDTTTIFCDDTTFFQKYFDFDTDYAKIKSELRDTEILENALELGSGIRILRQDPLEIIISFIISANNNIPRIKKSLERLCERYGVKKGEYYAFPTLQKLKKVPEAFFLEIGCGYRAPYLVKTIQMLSEKFIQSLYSMDIIEARKELIKLSGVGGKVADCILLFGYYRTNVFPCDTWIKKVYVQHFNGDCKLPAGKISEYFVSLYGNNAGFAQQYLYYYKRLKEKKKVKEIKNG